jgi:thiamine transporter
MKNKTKILVECALMIALATVLSEVKIPLWLQGGSVTAASSLPIIIISYRHNLKWGILTGFTHGVIQMMLGFHNVLYCKTLASQFGCIMLDYILAFTALGLASGIGTRLKKRSLRLAAGVSAVMFARFLASFFSGILLWGAYAPQGTPVWIHSLVYNGGYMLPEWLITLTTALLLHRYAARRIYGFED